MSIFSKKTAQTKFVSIFEGKFELPAEPGTPGAISRVTKTGKVKTYLPGEALTGFVKDVRIVKKEKYGYELNIKMTVKDGENDTLVIICTPSMSGFAQGFYKRMEGINWTLPVKIETFSSTKDSTTYTYCSVLQDGYRLPNLYKEDQERAKIPAYEETEVNGQKQFDKTAAMLWWNEKLENIIQPHFSDKLTELLQEDDSDLITAAFESIENRSVLKAVATAKNEVVDNDDDLPF